MLSRRCAIVCLFAIVCGNAAPCFVHAADEPKPDVEWHDLRDIGIEGRGWNDTARFYCRLPAKAEAVVRKPVWDLAQSSAGMCGRFITDAKTIMVRYELRSDKLEYPHMAATGKSGVDLYARDAKGQWRWVGASRPSKFPINEETLANGLPEGSREYMLYLPLYNGVEKVEIGLPKGASFKAAPAWPGGKKPIVFYGTSITQGASVMRAGMTYSALLGRWLERPIINLGFSGNGKSEPEVADLLAELDPCVYVINPLPNMTASEVTERMGPLVKKIRAKHPDTPIVLVEDRWYPYGWWNKKARERNETSHAALQAVHKQLLADGVKGLSYLSADEQLDPSGNDTVDGSHPTDLGFLHMAEAMRPVIEPLVKGKE